MSESLVLLAVHAHPDDESLGTGGILARYASEGIKTVLVCATKGEEGDILNPNFDTSNMTDSISELRIKELEKACSILGIDQTFFLGYRDSGMNGSASNSRSDVLINADIDEAAARLVKIMREVRPHVVVTYNEFGFYGHPDHIAVNRITLAAMKASGDPSRFTDISEPAWSPKKLYYTATPRNRLLTMIQAMNQTGEEIDFNVDLISTPDEDITAWIDVSQFIDQKLNAIKSHESQIGPDHFTSRLTGSLAKEAFGMECYVCVQGCNNSSVKEDDLFFGIRSKR